MKCKDCIHYTAHKHFYFGEDEKDFDEYFNDDTKPDDLILDPFMGSFTTAICCHRLGRHFIGAEKDEKYFAMGQKRLEDERRILRLI